MKQKLSLLLALLMLFTLFGCSGGQSSTEAPAAQSEATADADITEEVTEAPTEEPTEPPTTLEDYINATYFNPTDSIVGTYVLIDRYRSDDNEESLDWAPALEKAGELFHVYFTLQLREDGTGFAELPFFGIYLEKDVEWNEDTLLFTTRAPEGGDSVSGEISMEYTVENQTLQCEYDYEEYSLTWVFQKTSDYVFDVSTLQEDGTYSVHTATKDGIFAGSSVEDENGNSIEGLIWYSDQKTIASAVEESVGLNANISDSPAGTYLYYISQTFDINRDTNTATLKYYTSFKEELLIKCLTNHSETGFEEIILQEDGAGTIGSNYSTHWYSDEYGVKIDVGDGYGYMYEDGFIRGPVVYEYERMTLHYQSILTFGGRDIFIKISDNTDSMTAEEVAQAIHFR